MTVLRSACTALAAFAIANPAWSAVSIDEFSDAGSFNCGFPGFALMAGPMAFGHRLVSGNCSRLLSGTSVLVEGGTMAFGFSDLQGADASLGVSQAADFEPLVPGVRPPLDLTEGGVNTGLEIRLRADSDLTLNLTLGAAGGSGGVALQFTPGTDFETVFIPFVSLGGTAVASALTSVNYRFTETTPQAGGVGGAAFSSAGSGEIDYIRAVAAVPEPGTWGLMLAGLVVAGGAARCRRALNDATRATA